MTELREKLEELIRWDRVKSPPHELLRRDPDRATYVGVDAYEPADLKPLEEICDEIRRLLDAGKTDASQ